MAQSAIATGAAAGGRPGAPRQRLPRGAQAHRGGAEVGPAAGGGGDQLARARHRHGRGRPGRSRSRRRRRSPPGCSGSAGPGTRSGAVSRGVVFPKHRGDLLSCAVVARAHARRADRGAALSAQPARRAGPADRRDGRDGPVARSTSSPRWSAGPRRSPSCRPRALDATLDMLSGRYPSTAFAELRPRIVWDRATDLLTGRPGAQHLAVTSGGTIPDRGLFGVFLAGAERGGPGGRAGRGDGLRVAGRRRLPARLDLVADRGDHAGPGAGLARPGRAGPDAVLEGRPARAGRSSWAGRSGRKLREIVQHGPRAGRADLAGTGLDAWAADNLLSYVDEQRDGDPAPARRPHRAGRAVPRRAGRLAAGRALRARREGQRRLGAGDRAPADRAVRRGRAGAAQRRRHRGAPARHVDPSGRTPPPGAELVVFDPEEIAQLVEESIGSSAMFAARFRECAARALLLPRRDPRRRQPLWQQRQRAAQLLDVAREFADFPVTLEAARECLQDVLDVPGLVELMRDVAGRKVRLVEVETQRPSPFARSLLFGYVGAFLYGGDVPLAERRAAALALDSTLLGELLGRVELRELLDPAVVAETERRLQWLDGSRDACATPRTWSSCCGSSAICPRWRCVGRGGATRVAGRAGRRRAGRSRSADRRRGAARDRAEDAGRMRDGARGGAAGRRSPQAYLEPVRRPDRRSRRPLRPHPRPVHRGRRARPGSASASSWWSRPSSASARGGPGHRRRVHPVARRDGAEWCDARGAAAAAPALAGRAAPGDRAGTPRGARRVPAALAPDRLGSRPGRRGGRGGDGAAAGRADPRLGVGAAGAAGPGRRLHPGLPGRALRLGRAGLGRRRLDPRRGRLDRVRLGRDGAAAAAARRPGLAAERTARAGARRTGGGRRCSSASSPSRSTRRARARALAAIWDLVWAGLVSNDTLAPGPGPALRRRRAQARAATRAARPVPRPRPGLAGEPAQRARSAAARSAAPPTVAGRWYLLPDRDTNPTRRATALAEALLERHGVLTRGAVYGGGPARRVRGRLSGARRAGGARRRPGGATSSRVWAAQFAVPGAVDRLRALDDPGRAGCRGPARARPRERSCWPRPTPPTRTAPRCPGPSGWSRTASRAKAPSRARARGGAGRATGQVARRVRWWSRSPATSPLRGAWRADATLLCGRSGAARPGRAGAGRRGQGRRPRPTERGAGGRRGDPGLTPARSAHRGRVPSHAPRPAPAPLTAADGHPAPPAAQPWPPPFRPPPAAAPPPTAVHCRAPPCVIASACRRESTPGR